MTMTSLNRREFLKQSATAAAAIAATGLHAKPTTSGAASRTKRTIVIGIDGMDPFLTESMMKAGQLPNLNKLRQLGGYSRLGTSTPPQSPVAWANFINGAGPGSHGIFDFIHRDPARQCAPVFSVAETVPGEGYVNWGDHKVPFDFWPFNHTSSVTELRRGGTPFWDYLDKAGIRSVFYDLPANYPPSPSKYGNHKSLSGLGTPDMLGTYGTYQHFAEDGPIRPKNDGGGRQSRIAFANDTATVSLIGPTDQFLKKTRPTAIDFQVHRDRDARAALLEIQGQRILLEEGQWSSWTTLGFRLSMPTPIPDKRLSGICRFYLQEVAPNFRLYVTPVNIDPSNPAQQISEPDTLIRNISGELGLFYTTGFQEDHKALSSGIFSDDEFVSQAEHVLEERLRLLRYATDHYDDGLLFFYFSSTDMQAHMLWWDSKDKHPTRSQSDAKKYFGVLKGIYRRMDDVVGNILKRYGRDATIMILSDHGFARFQRQFNLNTWLRDNGYIQSPRATSLFRDVSWNTTRAYGLGINSLYLNQEGRERDGIVGSGAERESLLQELVTRLERVKDSNGARVIQKVHRADKEFPGAPRNSVPDLVIGYRRPYRASWDTCLGGMTREILFDNDSAWAADHCTDPSEVPGVLFCNRPIMSKTPSLVDVAPTILAEFGLRIPTSMEGRDILNV